MFVLQNKLLFYIPECARPRALKVMETIVYRRKQKQDRKCTTYKHRNKSPAKMYKPLRAYNCIRVKGECARPRAHMTAKRGETLALMVTYFFFGPAALANLEPRLLATALVPLGEATVP